MSSVVSTTLQDRASGKNLPILSMISGSAKSWASVNNIGATTALFKSFNVSSVGDNGVGSHAIAFTAVFTDANYSAVGNVSGNASSYGYMTPYQPASSYVNQKNYTTINSAAALADMYAHWLAFHGDLA